jgi:hypothetical protein
MWPFNRKKSGSDAAIESMPIAIDVASQKWLEFVSQPFAASMNLDEKLFRFTEGLGLGLKQWQAFKGCPDSLMLLIAAKGAERSGTHLRIEIETALRFSLPTPHERTDEEENRILMDRIIDRACRKWRYFYETIKFNDGTPLEKRIEIFQIPFVQGIKNDMPMFFDAPDDFFRQMVVLGITDSGTLSPEDIETAFDLVS